MTLIHVNDIIFKNAVPEKIAKNTSPSNKEFNTILKTSMENRSKLNQQPQKPPVNIIPETQFNTFRPEETKPVGKVLLVQGFEDTKIEVMGLATPGTRPVILESLERIVIEEGSLPSKIEKITPFEADKMKKELTGIQNKMLPSASQFDIRHPFLLSSY